MTFCTGRKWKAEIEQIKSLGLLGKNMTDIAGHYGVTRQLIKQVVDRHIPDWADKYGKAVVHKQRAEKYFSKWGERQTTDLYKIQRLKFSGKKSNALRLGIPWTISFGELEWPSHCPVLGIELNYYAEKAEEASPSFDRTDSNLGYEVGNVRIISWRANRVKNDGTAEEHRLIADYLDKISST